jgi:hypothetical protein
MAPDLPFCRSIQKGIYKAATEEEGKVELEVNTFCVHGGPGGRLSGIQVLSISQQDSQPAWRHTENHSFLSSTSPSAPKGRAHGVASRSSACRGSLNAGCLCQMVFFHAQGAVSCANPVLLKLLPEFETGLEREEMIVEKCVLRFPSLPFIPAEPYNVIRTGARCRPCVTV